MKRAVIFDFDGTIADSLPAIIELFEELTKRPKKFSKAQVEKLRALSLMQLSRELKVPRWKIPFLLFRGRKQLHAHLHGIPVHAGLPMVLELLAEQQVPLYIVSSNSTENIQSYLAWHKLSHLFTGVYGGAGLLGKAALLRKLIKQEGLDTHNTWYVGDEMRDIAAARAAGMHMVSVTWGFNTRAGLITKDPDAVVDTAQELLNVLRKAWKK